MNRLTYPQLENYLRIDVEPPERMQKKTVTVAAGEEAKVVLELMRRNGALKKE